MDKKIRLCEKYLLSINEATEYFGIGEKKLRYLIDNHINDDNSFIIRNGNKYLISRKRFEQYIDRCSTI